MNTQIINKKQADIKQAERLVQSFRTDLEESNREAKNAFQNKDLERARIYSNLVSFYLREVEKAEIMKKRLIIQKKSLLSMMM